MVASVSFGMRGMPAQSMAGVRDRTPTFPMQPETLNYLKGGGRPSFAFTDAVNTLIFRLKAAGAFSTMLAGFLLCGDGGENLALYNLRGDGSTAIRVGSAIAYTPGQGYGGAFDGTNYVDFGWSSAAIGAQVFGAVTAGIFSSTNSVANTAGPIISNGGSPATANVLIDASGAQLRQHGVLLTGFDGPWIGGQADGGQGGVAGIPGSNGGSGPGAFTSLRTGSTCNGALVRLSLLFVYPAGLGYALNQRAQILATQFLYDLAALS